MHGGQRTPLRVGSCLPFGLSQGLFATISPGELGLQMCMTMPGLCEFWGFELRPPYFYSQCFIHHAIPLAPYDFVIVFGWLVGFIGDRILCSLIGL